MTLEQATQAVLTAVEAEDLGALARAIEERQEALRTTPRPGREVLDLGERACRALQTLKQRWAAEDSRLHQLRLGFVESAAAVNPHVEFIG